MLLAPSSTCALARCLTASLPALSSALATATTSTNTTTTSGTLAAARILPSLLLLGGGTPATTSFQAWRTAIPSANSSSVWQSSMAQHSMAAQEEQEGLPEHTREDPRLAKIQAVRQKV